MIKTNQQFETGSAAFIVSCLLGYILCLTIELPFTALQKEFLRPTLFNGKISFIEYFNLLIYDSHSRWNQSYVVSILMIRTICVIYSFLFKFLQLCCYLIS